MLVLYKRWNEHNEIQLTKNKMNLNNQKWKIIHPPPSEESHPVTLGSDSERNRNRPYLNTRIIKKILIFDKKWKKYNEIQLTINKMGLNNRKMKNYKPSPIRKFKNNAIW